jgi:hypothetical protein
VATALLSVLMTRRPPGVERIITVVSADNEASLAMLRRLGDVEVSEASSDALGVVVELPGATTPRPHMSAASLFRPGREWVAKRSRATSSAPDDA